MMMRMKDDDYQFCVPILLILFNISVIENHIFWHGFRLLSNIR